jgi:hypothetical protein
MGASLVYVPIVPTVNPFPPHFGEGSHLGRTTLVDGVPGTMQLVHAYGGPPSPPPYT